MSEVTSKVSSKATFFAPRRASEARIEAVTHSSWAQLTMRFSTPGAAAIAAATPFQNGGWLQAWYDTVGAQAGTEPLPLEIRDAATGRPLFGVPLIKRRYNSQWLVEFADAGLTDYNAPLVGVGWASPVNRAGAFVSPKALQKLLRQHLQGCDQLQFRKMPMEISGSPNPFAYLAGRSESVVGTNVVSIYGSWSEYRARLAKKVRKELERSFRVFQRDGSNARFCTIDDPSEAYAILERMEVLQAERMRELQQPFFLNEPQYSAFYRRLIELDLASGKLLLTVLRSDPDDVVGALLGLVDGESYAMVRLAHAGKAWSHCSPGKIMIEQTMAYLHRKGVKRFDFTTGDYNYKKGFLPESQPLVDVSLGISMGGRARIGARSVLVSSKDQLRRFPKTYGWLKRMAPEPDAKNRSS